MVTVYCNLQGTDEIMAKKQAGLQALNEITVAKRIKETMTLPEHSPLVREILCDVIECDKIAAVYCTDCEQLHCHNHILSECDSHEPKCLYPIEKVYIDWDMLPVGGAVAKGDEPFAK
jgi:hypothetical protein